MPENGHSTCPGPSPGQSDASEHSKLTIVPSTLEDVHKMSTPLLFPPSSEGVRVPSILPRASVHALSGHRVHGLKKKKSYQTLAVSLELSSLHWTPVPPCIEKGVRKINKT